MYFVKAPAGQIHCNLIVEQDRTGHVYLHPVIPDLAMSIHLHCFDETAHSKADRTARKFWEKEFAKEGFSYLGVTKPTMLDVYDYEDQTFRDWLVLRFDDTASAVVRDPKLLMLADELGDRVKYLMHPQYRVTASSHLDLLVEHWHHWVHLGRTKSLNPWCITVETDWQSNSSLRLKGAVEVNFNHSAISRAFPKGSRGKEYLIRLVLLALRSGLVVVPGLARGRYSWTRLEPKSGGYHASYDHHHGIHVTNSSGDYCLIEEWNSLVGKYIEPIGKYTYGGLTRNQHDFLNGAAGVDSRAVSNWHLKVLQLRTFESRVRHSHLVAAAKTTMEEIKDALRQ